MLRLKVGNLLKANESIIVHQVNTRGKMNSGVAKQVKKVYPEAYNEYKKLSYVHVRNRERLLGLCQNISIGHDKYVANVFGQLEYGRNKNIVYTNYNALEKGLKEVYEFAKNNNLNINEEVWKINGKSIDYPMT